MEDPPRLFLSVPHSHLQRRSEPRVHHFDAPADLCPVCMLHCPIDNHQIRRKQRSKKQIRMLRRYISAVWASTVRVPLRSPIPAATSSPAAGLHPRFRSTQSLRDPGGNSVPAFQEEFIDLFLLVNHIFDNSIFLQPSLIVLFIPSSQTMRRV